jgi:hypothetical protein
MDLSAGHLEKDKEVDRNVLPSGQHLIDCKDSEDMREELQNVDINLRSKDCQIK